MLQVILYLLKIFHILFVIFIQIAPYIISNVYIFCFIILINMLIVTQWYINNGHCIITQLEYHIDDMIKSKEKNDSIKYKKSSILENTLLKIFPFLTDNMVNYIIAFGPLFSTIMCLFKIITI